MLATGVIDPVGRTFDIAGVEEYNTSISTMNGQLRLSYTTPGGELVQLVKQLNQGGDGIAIGDALGVSPATENSKKGFGQRTTQKTKGHARALTSVDWSDTTKLTTKTWVDDNGVQRTAVLLPVTLL